MTWKRQPLADTLAAQISAYASDAYSSPSVFGNPPQTFNVPAIVVYYPRLVRFSAVAFSIDEIELVVTCFGGMDGVIMVDTLADIVRQAVMTDPSIGGTAQSAHPLEQLNWRGMNVAGADFLATDVVLAIQQ
jgi:hypothetical protein